MSTPLERRFDLALSQHIAWNLTTYATVYRHLIERLGVEETHGLWDAVPETPDALTRGILALEARPELEPLSDALLLEGVNALFASPVRGVTGEEAAAFLRGRPPFSPITLGFAPGRGVLSVTAYQSLHLFRDALARVAEEAMARHGTAGELMIYDALLGEAAGMPPISADEFMAQRLARYQTAPETPSAYSTGLDITLVRGDEREILAHVTRCEWADYYREHHPAVGYLLACALDDPMYRRLCPSVRFQRRCTLMEGGAYCEFFFYRTDL